VVPDWIATERVRQELARMAPQARAAAPIPLGPSTSPPPSAGVTRNDEQVVLEAGKGLLGDGS
jgi:hypothetical protein